jgi:hypothetical protein
MNPTNQNPENRALPPRPEQPGRPPLQPPQRPITPPAASTPMPSPIPTPPAELPSAQPVSPLPVTPDPPVSPVRRPNITPINEDAVLRDIAVDEIEQKKQPEPEAVSSLEPSALFPSVADDPQLPPKPFIPSQGIEGEINEKPASLWWFALAGLVFSLVNLVATIGFNVLLLWLMGSGSSYISGITGFMGSGGVMVVATATTVLSVLIAYVAARPILIRLAKTSHPLLLTLGVFFSSWAVSQIIYGIIGAYVVQSFIAGSPGIAFTPLLFGVSLFSFINYAIVFLTGPLIGLLLGYLYERVGSVWPFVSKVTTVIFLLVPLGWRLWQEIAVYLPGNGIL